jgi:small-conductance mechanosensitive channel
MPRFPTLALPLAVLLSALAASAARAADPAAAPTIRADHQAEDLGHLLDVARERGEAVVVRIEPPASPGEAPQATAATVRAARARSLESSALDVVGGLGDALLAGLDQGIAGLPRLPWLAGALAEKWRTDRVNATSSADGLARIAAVLVAGLIAGLLVRAVALVLIRRRAAPPACFMDGFAAALRGLVAEGAGLAVFALVASRLIELLLPQADFARFLARDISGVAVSFGFYLIGARFLLAPDEPARRLLPIRRPVWHYRAVTVYALGAVFIYVTVLPVAAVGDGPALAGWFLLTSTATFAYKLWWFWSGRHDFAVLVHGKAATPSHLRRFAGALASWILMGVALLIWLLGRLPADSADTVRLGIAAGFTQLAVALLPILAVGADRLAAAGLGGQEADATPLRKATPAVGRTLATSAVWALGAVVLADVWGLYVMALGSAMGRAVLTAVITIGVAIVTGWSAWRFAAAYLAAHAPKLRTTPPGEDDHDEPPAQSRLATALPLVRATILGLVIGLTTLIVLSSLGLDIGPLLAGFGVVGLAISFGSQALVRDIVSGIFFMADDAFRVGEYIDTGRLKGTVEKITLRSVQLRHQSGLVHTIPFGQLQAITNASRDWATVKFNIRLERGTDLEKARKIIKKVGQEMLEDAEIAAEIILPLKLQGVADITDNAIVCRLKFTAKPNRASWVQREALKRVYAALEADGLQFASGAVTVKASDPERPPSPLAAAGVAQRMPTEVAG